MGAHTFNSRTREAEAGRSLWGQPGLQSSRTFGYDSKKPYLEKQKS